MEDGKKIHLKQDWGTIQTKNEVGVLSQQRTPLCNFVCYVLLSTCKAVLFPLLSDVIFKYGSCISELLISWRLTKQSFALFSSTHAAWLVHFVGDEISMVTLACPGLISSGKNQNKAEPRSTTCQWRNTIMLYEWLLNMKVNMAWSSIEMVEGQCFGMHGF